MPLCYVAKCISFDFYLWCWPNRKQNERNRKEKYNNTNNLERNALIRFQIVGVKNNRNKIDKQESRSGCEQSMNHHVLNNPTMQAIIIIINNFVVSTFLYSVVRVSLLFQIVCNEIAAGKPSHQHVKYVIINIFYRIFLSNYIFFAESSLHLAVNS